VTRTTAPPWAQALAATLCGLALLALTGCAEDPFDRLADQLEGRNVYGRLAAIQELKYMRDERAIDSLLEALEDPEVLPQAAEALVYKGLKTKTKKKGDPVIEAVTREMQATHLDAPTRAAAAWVLGQIGDREAIPALKGAAGDATPLVAANAKDALKQLGYYAAAPVPMYIVNRPPYPGMPGARGPSQLMATISAVEISADGIGWTMAAPLLVPKQVDLGSPEARTGDGILLTTDTALIGAGTFTWLRVNIAELWVSDGGRRKTLVKKVPEDAVVETPHPLQPLVLGPKDSFAGLVVPADWPPNGRLVLNLWLDEIVSKTASGYTLQGRPRASLAYVGDVGRGSLVGSISGGPASAHAVVSAVSMPAGTQISTGAFDLRLFPPYAVTCQADGAFRFDGLPPGEYDVTVWLDLSGDGRPDHPTARSRKPVKVAAGKQAQAEMIMLKD
jgi:hypothetical protein